MLMIDVVVIDVVSVVDDDNDITIMMMIMTLLIGGSCCSRTHYFAEGHAGTDGRYYIVDFARVMPPEYIRPRARMWHSRGAFFTLLRPEFVKSFSEPLCPDALRFVVLLGVYTYSSFTYYTIYLHTPVP